ncbi:hypothetical protein AABB24_015673, partial [Solanum stoloniferum]
KPSILNHQKKRKQPQQLEKKEKIVAKRGKRDPQVQLVSKSDVCEEKESEQLVQAVFKKHKQELIAKIYLGEDTHIESSYIEEKFELPLSSSANHASTKSCLRSSC